MKSIIHISMSGDEALRTLGYLLGSSAAAAPSKPSGETVGAEAPRDPANGSSDPNPGATIEFRFDLDENLAAEARQAGDGSSEGGRISSSDAMWDAHRRGVNLSQLPYRTSATYAGVLAERLRSYERKYNLAISRGTNSQAVDRLMPNFTPDLGAVVIPLAETILRIPNPIARRDFFCAFMGYYAARCAGYVLDYDAIPDIMELWRGSIIDEGDESEFSKAEKEILEKALNTLSLPLTKKMRCRSSRP